MRTNLQFSEDFFSFTKEIFNGKVHILCSVFVNDLRTKSGKDESRTISGSPSDKENQPKHNVLYHEKSPLNKLLGKKYYLMSAMTLWGYFDTTTLQKHKAVVTGLALCQGVKRICSKCSFNLLTLSWEGPYHIETSPLICKANQWNGFFIIGISTMKWLMHNYCIQIVRCILKVLEQMLQDF